MTFIKYRDLHYFNRDKWKRDELGTNNYDFEFTMEMVEKIGK